MLFSSAVIGDILKSHLSIILTGSETSRSVLMEPGICVSHQNTSALFFMCAPGYEATAIHQHKRTALK